jgi:adenylosuccinate synthase
MAVRVLVGAQWGDEGKGKVVDWLGRDVDFIARYAGGPNAGHTVVVAGKKTILHHIPSGILTPGTQCLLGNGVVVDAEVLLKEIQTLEAGGVDCRSRIGVSPRAHVILGTHRTLDRVTEEARGSAAIGTTGKGIGPAYGDKVLRRGVRVGDLVDPAVRDERVRAEVEEMNRVLQGRYGVDPIDPAEILDEARRAGELLAPMVMEVGAILRQAIREGKGVLLEGAQGTLLDLDHGTYPYATSSSATSGGACTGCAIPPTSIDSVWGVTKAYCTRVGNGPFPTEMLGTDGDELRERGGEYGATTGRPRRCGWFDAVAGRYAVDVNGLDALAVTKLDILTGVDPIRICTGYRIDGKVRTEFPHSVAELERSEPVYEEHPGWTESIEGVRRAEDLPAAARAYLNRLAELSGCEIALVGVGPERDQVITDASVGAVGAGGRTLA